jgi:predicted esterase
VWIDDAGGQSVIDMQKHLKISVKASYRTLNKRTQDTRRIWIVFHGQGMLTQYFIQKFTTLDPSENFIIAPQGLSKYYLEGHSGRVGASWMTKEDRLVEIENQVRYLDAVIEEEGVIQSNAEIILFGFSQGGATASRYGAYGSLSFDHLVLWAGMFPPDISKEEIEHWKPETRITYFTGNQDPYLKEGMVEQQEHTIKNVVGKPPRLIRFEGDHRVVPDLLSEI